MDTPDELGAASNELGSVVGIGYTRCIGRASMEALLGCGMGSWWETCDRGGWYSPGRCPQGVLMYPRRELTGPNSLGSTAELFRSGGRIASGGRSDMMLGWPGLGATLGGRCGSEKRGTEPYASPESASSLKESLSDASSQSSSSLSRGLEEPIPRALLCWAPWRRNSERAAAAATNWEGRFFPARSRSWMFSALARSDKWRPIRLISSSV